MLHAHATLNCVSYITGNAKRKAVNKTDARSTRADETFGSLQFSFPVCHASVQLLTLSVSCSVIDHFCSHLSVRQDVKITVRLFGDFVYLVSAFGFQ
jgi:hypothetical protein